MPTTTNGLPIPALTDAPNGPGAFQALGDGVDARYGLPVANYAGLAAIDSPFPGMRAWLLDQKGFAVWDGTNWVEPDRTGSGTFTASGLAAGALQGYTIPFGFTRANVPADVTCQISGFVSNSSQAVIKGVTTITTTGFDLQILNAGGSSMSFSALPVRFRVYR